MSKPRRRYRELGEYVRESIRDPKDAAEYLNAAAQDSDNAAFLVALKDVLDVHGSLSELSRNTGLNRANLHKMLQGKSSPRLDTLTKVLASAGLRITIQPMRRRTVSVAATAPHRMRDKQRAANG